MSDETSATDFDQALIGSAFEQIAARGWRQLNLADAARTADLPLDRARARFPTPPALLFRLGALADEAALAEASGAGLAGAVAPSPRERLFDMLMRRFDVFQQHRAGVIALLRDLPSNPGLALLLAGATSASMRWMLQGAGIDTGGVRGALRVNGLVGLWLYALRAWERDDSPDLAGTMAALDRALERASAYDGVLRHAPAADAEIDPALAAVIVPEDEPPPAAAV